MDKKKLAELARDTKAPLSSYEDRIRAEVNEVPLIIKEQLMTLMRSGTTLGDAARSLNLTLDVAGQIFSDQIEKTTFYSLSKDIK